MRGFADGAAIAGYGGRKGMVGDALGGAGRWPLPPLPGARAGRCCTCPATPTTRRPFWHAGSRTLISGDAVPQRGGGQAWFTPRPSTDVAAAEKPEYGCGACASRSICCPARPAGSHGTDVWAGAP